VRFCTRNLSGFRSIKPSTSILRRLFFRSRQRPRRSTLFPYTTLFRSVIVAPTVGGQQEPERSFQTNETVRKDRSGRAAIHLRARDRKSTRLNSSHVSISYAVFCLKKKNKSKKQQTRRHNHQSNHTHHT